MTVNELRRKLSELVARDSRHGWKDIVVTTSKGEIYDVLDVTPSIDDEEEEVVSIKV